MRYNYDLVGKNVQVNYPLSNTINSNIRGGVPGVERGVWYGVDVG